MKRHLWILLTIGATVVGTGCQTSAPPTKSTVATKVQVDGKTLAFKHPGTGDTFALHLGDELFHDTGGMTEVPRHIKDAVRDATSSYYDPTNKDGAGYVAAESLYTHNQADLVARNTTIQYQPDSGRLLITENKSDGRPCLRFILYTSRRSGGYKATYLAPGYTRIPGGNPIDSVPSEIHLLPGNRAEINGKVVRIDDIPQSPHPFSVGL